MKRILNFDTFYRRIFLQKKRKKESSPQHKTAKFNKTNEARIMKNTNSNSSEEWPKNTDLFRAMLYGLLRIMPRILTQEPCFSDITRLCASPNHITT